MTLRPESLPEGATAGQAAAFPDEHPFGAAPVTDDAGHPVGVLSRTDVLSYESGRAAGAVPAPPRPAGSVAVQGAALRANDLMSPTVFSVSPEAPAEEVAAQMVQLNVHRLFVVDRPGRRPVA
jgi:CBS domain-containing protein